MMPKANVTFERYTFNQLVQQEGEHIDEFVTKVKAKAKKCEFLELEESLIKDRIVIGVRSDLVREKLLSEESLDLNIAINICRLSEQATKQLQEMQHQSLVNSIKKVRERGCSS